MIRQMSKELEEQLIPILEKMSKKLMRSNSHLDDKWELINVAYQKILEKGMGNVGIEEMGKLVKTSHNAMLDFLRKENTQMRHRDFGASEAINLPEKSQDGSTNTWRESVEYNMSAGRNLYNDLIGSALTRDFLEMLEKKESRLFFVSWGYLKYNIIEYRDEFIKIVGTLTVEEKQELVEHADKPTRDLILRVICKVKTGINSGKSRGIIDDIKRAGRILMRGE